MPSDPVTKLRAASKNERRYIMRHALGWYHALIIGGIYTVDQKDTAFDATSAASYIPALKSCIETHPILSVAIQGADSESPEFVRPTTLDLQHHVQILDPKLPRYASTNTLELVRQVTLEIHDQPFTDVQRIPPWKIVVLPLPDEAGSLTKRIYIIYAYSHCHGDGKSGLAFHRTFLRGLQVAHRKYDTSPIFQPTPGPFPPPLEEACDLKISWSYLLSPLLGQYLPGFVSRWFGLQGSATPQTANTYIGLPMSYDPGNYHTGSQLLVVDHDCLSGVLATCRTQNAKFTGLLNQLVVRALSEALPAETQSENFIGQIVVDLRSLIPAYSDDTMGNCVSAIYEASPRCEKSQITDFNKHDKAFWDAARTTTTRLAESANTLNDQPVGLLKYLGNFRAWFLEKLGKDRDSSYEISNAGVFDPAAPGQSTADPAWDIERMIFSQPANVTASPLNFQVVTRKGGDMVITLNWQTGVLGVPDENTFTKDTLDRIGDLLAEVASN